MVSASCSRYHSSSDILDSYYLAMQGAVTTKHAPSPKNIVKGGQSR